MESYRVPTPSGGLPRGHSQTEFTKEVTKIILAHTAAMTHVTQACDAEMRAPRRRLYRTSRDDAVHLAPKALAAFAPGELAVAKAGVKMSSS